MSVNYVGIANCYNLDGESEGNEYYVWDVYLYPFWTAISFKAIFTEGSSGEEADLDAELGEVTEDVGDSNQT